MREGYEVGMACAGEAVETAEVKRSAERYAPPYFDVASTIEMMESGPLPIIG